MEDADEAVAEEEANLYDSDVSDNLSDAELLKDERLRRHDEEDTDLESLLMRLYF